MSGKHEELEEMFNDLEKFAPQEEKVDPVSPTVSGSQHELPQPAQLAILADREQIRSLLNAEAARILSEPTEKAYINYQQFLRRYGEAILRCWYVTESSPDNTILGYEIQKKIGEGAFATVYSAIDPDGQQVALKLLHVNARDKDDFLQSFRRGIRSMKILTESKISGVAAHLASFEIPALVVMELVKGPTLQQLVESKNLKGWQNIIRIAKDITRIIHLSHRLSQRVLHRDIRPANILIRDGWQDVDNGEVVVLDFDLSWHVQANEVSITHSTTGNGYLAPEQVRRKTDAPTRNGAVDSFGLGMTLLFMISGEHPMQNDHCRNEWAYHVKRCCTEIRKQHWQSVGNRVARLILKVTRDIQSERWDVAQIYKELCRIYGAINEPNSVNDAELWSEELLHRLVDADYEWDATSGTFFWDSRTCLVVRTEGRIVKESVAVEFTWVDKGVSQFKNRSQWIGQSLETLPLLIKDSSWRREELLCEAQNLRFLVSAPVTCLRNEFAKNLVVLKRVLDQFRRAP